VTLLAIRAQLPLVKVSVAILATCAHIAEHWLHMALRTGDVLVHSPQRIMSLIVIKFRNGADRFPAIRGVAILAGYVQIAMRAVGSRSILIRPARERA
jgi:hypothetical protein